MIIFRNIFAATIVAVVMWVPASAQAEVLLNAWQPIDDIVPGVPECGGAEVFYQVEGMAHTKIATLRNGMFAVHTNAMGTVTPLGSEEEGAMFRQNVSNVYPMMGENDVYTYVDTTKVITKGNAPNVHVKIRYHHTVIDGEVRSYFNIRDVSCE